jgi:hypothetical protein
MNLKSGRRRLLPVVLLLELFPGSGAVAVAVAVALMFPSVVFPGIVVPGSMPVLARFPTPFAGTSSGPTVEVRSTTGVINANCAVLFAERGGVVGGPLMIESVR